MNHLKKACFAMALLLAISGCKLTLVADPGGNIASGSGNYDCSGGSSCENELAEGVFSETFTATPDPGFKFAGWSGLCSEGLDPSNPTCSVFLSEEFTALDFDGELVANFNQKLVGTWLGGDDGQQGSLDDLDNLALVTLYEEGYFLVTRSAVDDPSAKKPQGGYARATYTFDGVLDLTGNIAAELLENSIGQYSGFDIGGLWGDLFVFKFAQASDDTLTLTIRNRFGGGELTFRRLVPGAEAIQGTWTIGDVTDFESFAQIAFYDGFFLVSQYCDNGPPEEGGGLQYGTYTWDANTGQLGVTVLRDTLGGCGLYDMVNDVPNVRFIKPQGGSALLLINGDTRIKATALR